MNSQSADKPRALYIAQISAGVTNGMSQRSHQVLAALSAEFGGRVDVLSLGDSPAATQAWLDHLGVKAQALSGPFAQLARINTLIWLALGVLLCCKLKLFDNFPFPIVTPLPRRLANRYVRIVCFYAWPFHLLSLHRYGAKVIADLGDVMADRHKRVGVRRWISLYPSDERAILQSDAHIILVSRFDAREFERLYGRNLQVIPIVPPQYEELIALIGKERPRRLGYIGARSAFNEMALRELARPEFLAGLREAGVELVIAGRICLTADPKIIEALRAGGAQVVGEVGSLTDFYERIGGLINPVGPSSGLKVKSVEALLAGRSLVTTEWGTDAVLDDVFTDQIVRLDWPLDPNALARAAIGVVDQNFGDRQARSRAYVDGAETALQALLRN